MDPSLFDAILAELTACAAAATSFTAFQQTCVSTIAERLPAYHWVGFYMLDPADENFLVLGPFHGAPTPHVRIPINQGICGAAVTQGDTVIVDDVSLDPRYLACSLETRSEIVVPILAHGRIVGEIDIDSHLPAAFTASDRFFLERCAQLAGSLIERLQPSSGIAK